MTNTPEANKNILEVKTLEEDAVRLFPAEWMALPKSISSVHQYDIQPDGSRKFAPVIPCILKCAGPVATDDEIKAIIEMVKAKGDPVAFLVHLACLEVVDFPEGQDPTVKDFFEGNFDPSSIGKKLALVSYAHFAEAKK